MNPGSFFGELKRRNVYKVAVAYAVVSWLLVQSASILFPTFEAPTWMMKVFVALLVLCFPVALILSWAFEITPEGIKLEHTALAIANWLYSFDFSQAITEFQRAIDLNPNYAIAHQQYGNILLTALGRFDEAIAEGKRAVELDPLSLVINADLGVDYYFARRYDEAIAQLRKTLEMDPGYYYAHIDLGEALEMKGARDSAIAEYQKALALNDDPYILGLLARSYGLSGNKTETENNLNQLKELSTHRYVAAYSFSLGYLGLGDKEEALRWLEQSYQDHAGSDIGWIRVDPFLDPLHGDPRFEALAEKIVPAREFRASSK